MKQKLVIDPQAAAALATSAAQILGLLCGAAPDMA